MVYLNLVQSDGPLYRRAHVVDWFAVPFSCGLYDYVDYMSFLLENELATCQWMPFFFDDS